MTISIPGNYVTVQPNANGSVTFTATEPPPGVVGLGTSTVTVDPNITAVFIQNTIAMLQAVAQQL